MVLTNHEHDTLIKFANAKVENKFRNEPNILRFAAYLRKSQEDEANSLNTQLAEVKKMFEDLKSEFPNYQLILEDKDIYAEDGVSGLFLDRGKLTKLINGSCKKEYDGVITLRNDRIGRGSSFETIRNILLMNYCLIISTRDRDNGDAVSELMRYVLNGLNIYHARNAAALSSLSMNNLAKDAKCIGRLPLGFTADENKNIIICEEEAKIVRKAFELAASATPIIDIATTLNDLGYKTRDGFDFISSTIATMLRNEKYDGTYIYNNEKRKDSEYRRTHRVLLDQFSEIRLENAIPRIIDHNVFVKVQGILDLKKRTHFHHHDAQDYLLTGKIKCKNCSKALYGSSTISGSSHKRYRLYVCHNYKRHINDCHTRALNAEYIESIVRKVITSNINMLLQEHPELLATLHIDNQKQVEDQIRNIQKGISKLNREITKITDKIINEDDESLIERFKAKYKEIEKQIVAEQFELEKLQGSLNVINSQVNDASTSKITITEDMLFENSVIGKRLVECLIDEILYDNDEIIIKFK